MYILHVSICYWLNGLLPLALADHSLSELRVSGEQEDEHRKSLGLFCDNLGIHEVARRWLKSQVAIIESLSMLSSLCRSTFRTPAIHVVPTGQGKQRHDYIHTWQNWRNMNNVKRMIHYRCMWQWKKPLERPRVQSWFAVKGKKREACIDFTLFQPQSLRT